MSAGNRADRQSIRYLPHQRIIEIAAVKKGDKRQALVNGSLRRIAKKGYIVDGGVFPSNSPEDGRGIDAWLLRWDGKKIEFQIKGCEEGVKEHLKKYPTIPVVLVCGLELKESIDCLLIDQFCLSSLPKVFRETIGRTLKRKPVAKKPVAQLAIFSIGSNGSNGSREKRAQSAPCY